MSRRRQLQLQHARRDAAALDAQIGEIFAAAMPSEPMQDARRQMQARLDRIRKTGAGPEYFLRRFAGPERRRGAIAEDHASTR